MLPSAFGTMKTIEARFWPELEKCNESPWDFSSCSILARQGPRAFPVSTITLVKTGSTFALRRSTLDFYFGGQRALRAVCPHGLPFIPLGRTIHLKTPQRVFIICAGNRSPSDKMPGNSRVRLQMAKDTHRTAGSWCPTRFPMELCGLAPLSEFHLTQCINLMALESQLPHKIVNLSFQSPNWNNNFTILRGRWPSKTI